MGDERSFIPKPNPENPEGFFENYDFRTINDEVLEKNGYVVKDWHTALPDLNASFFTRRKINKTLRSYHKKHSKWGWKDPRQMLTLRIWLSSLRKLKCQVPDGSISRKSFPLFLARDMLFDILCGEV
jgi:hypothetical protein